MQATLFRTVDYFMNAYLSINNFAVVLLLDMIAHFQNRISHRIVTYSVVCWRCYKLQMSISTLLQNKNIQGSALFNIIIQQPQNIIESVHFGIIDARYQWSHVSSDPEWSVTQRPVSVNIQRALNCNGCTFILDGV